MNNWQDAIVQSSESLGRAIESIDRSGAQAVMVVNENQKFIGLLTDGNVRRAILGGASLEDSVIRYITADPYTTLPETSRELVQAVMRKNRFHHVPLVDAEGKVAGMITADDLLGMVERPNWIVLMVGGLGSRLYPLTEDCPKPMLEVGGKPILESIIQSFIDQGFRRFYLAVNYMADRISEYFGDGSAWGIEIKYLRENQKLGTAGALGLLPEKPEHPFFVMNGDILTKLSFENMLEFHSNHDAMATMAVRDYTYQIPFGVLTIEGERIVSIEEKPAHTEFVNAGIYVLSPESMEYVRSDEYLDMPTLFQKLIENGKPTSAFAIREYWLDIGRHDEFEKAQEEWQTK